MFRLDRAMLVNRDAGKRLPRLPELTDLYDKGFDPREGMLMMIAGRSGSQKSGFAMWLTSQWDQPTLYVSLDMPPFMAVERIAAMRTGVPSTSVAEAMKHDRDPGVGPIGREAILDSLRGSNIRFAFNTSSQEQIEAELDAWVEVHNEYPKIMVLDNLMDLDEAESDYTMQTYYMQYLNELSLRTGMTVIVLTHMRETDREAGKEWRPGPRSEIRNRLDQKPRIILSIALDPTNMAFNVAVVKQNGGKQDASASTYATLRAVPELTRFESWREHELIARVG